MNPMILSFASVLFLVPATVAASTVDTFPPDIEVLSQCAAYYGATEQFTKLGSPAQAFARQRTGQFQVVLMEVAKQQSVSERAETLLREDARKMRAAAAEMMASGNIPSWDVQRSVCEAIYLKDASLFNALYTIHHRIGALAN